MHDGIYAMIRTQIQFNERQLEALRRQAAREHASVSELVRRAVDAWIECKREPSVEEVRRRAIAVAGRFASAQGDVAEHHDDYLADAFGQGPSQPSSQ